jgi:type III restriction enzyme
LQMLEHMNLHPDAVEDIYFTGATTDPAKTDFYVEYRDIDGKAHRYVPDFLVRLKPEDGGTPGSGKCLIVEIKSAQHERVIRDELARGSAVSSEGRKALAVMELEKQHPDRIRYEIIFAPAGELLRSKSKKVRDFVASGKFEGEGK